MLGLSATTLADLSGVDLRTIQRFEVSEGIPANRAGTLQRIENTLKSQGIVFLGDPVTSPGVQLIPTNRPEPTKS